MFFQVILLTLIIYTLTSIFKYGIPVWRCFAQKAVKPYNCYNEIHLLSNVLINISLDESTQLNYIFLSL